MMPRVVLTLTVVCMLSAAVLGLAYVGTDRYATRARRLTEERAITTMLPAARGATLLEVVQSVDAAGERVVYRVRPYGDETAAPRTAVFTFDGERVADSTGSARLAPAGRILVAMDRDVPRGFIVDSSVRGYKNRVRFLVALAADFTLLGVRVVEHEEDPGLGAEIATPWFAGQFVGRSADDVSHVDVTRDPLPEDWRAALAEIRRLPADRWRTMYAPLIEREKSRPIHAVTGATISSRALTTGVRTAVQHFARRWALIAPWVEGAPS